MNSFFSKLKAKDFDGALHEFDALDKESKIRILQSFGQHISFSETPNYMVIGEHKLHEGKSLDNFIESWKPHAISSGESYYNKPAYINIVENIDDPANIATIGMAWCSEHDLHAELKSVKNDLNARTESMAKTATKTARQVYRVKHRFKMGTDF